MSTASDARARYRAGATLERAVKILLESAGYYVMKSGGSRGQADLIALKQGEIVLIQCKLDGYMPPAARESFRVLAETLMATPVVGMWWKEGTAARQVRLAFVESGPNGNTYLHDWSPDWALEEA